MAGERGAWHVKHLEGRHLCGARVRYGDSSVFLNQPYLADCRRCLTVLQQLHQR
jgi:hypothetical protein